MIITLFLDLIYGLLSFLINLLPTGSLPIQISSAVLYFWGTLNAFSYVFPVYALLGALLFVLSIDVAILLWHLLNWIIRKIPGMQ